MTNQPFWIFSIDRYHREGVAPLCLSLQESTDVDVNLVLLGLWLGSDCICIDRTTSVLYADIVRDWHNNVVRPLRGVRRWLKTPGEANIDDQEQLRNVIKSREIEAERIEQDMLYTFHCNSGAALCKSTNEKPRAMLENVKFLCQASGASPSDLKTLQTLVNLCL